MMDLSRDQDCCMYVDGALIIAKLRIEHQMLK